MTHPHPQDSEQVAYLESVFRLDPADQIEDVLALRNGFFTAIRPGFNTVKPETTTDGRAVLEQRAQVQQQLDEIRRSFWEMEPEQTRARLDQLDVDESPDLKLAVNRIRNALAAFDEMRAFRKYKWVNHEFAGMVEDVLTATPRDAGRIQQTLLLRISEDDWMRKQSRRMVKVIRKKHPLIAKLEMEWFDEIFRTRVLRRNKEFEPKVKSESSSRIPWGGAIFVLIMLVRVIITAGNATTGSQYPQSSSVRQSYNGITNAKPDSSTVRYRVRAPGESFGPQQLRAPQRALGAPLLGFDDGVTSSQLEEPEASTTSKENFNLIEHLSRNGKTARSQNDDEPTWPPRSGQRFESFLEAEKKTVSPPRNSRGTKKSLPLPQEPYDSIPADSILKQPLESQSQSGSLIFR
jgi:hypothetical protein